MGDITEIEIGKEDPMTLDERIAEAQSEGTIYHTVNFTKIEPLNNEERDTWWSFLEYNGSGMPFNINVSTFDGDTYSTWYEFLDDRFAQYVNEVTDDEGVVVESFYWQDKYKELVAKYTNSYLTYIWRNLYGDLYMSGSIINFLEEFNTDECFIQFYPNWHELAFYERLDILGSYNGINTYEDYLIRKRIELELKYPPQYIPTPAQPEGDYTYATPLAYNVRYDKNTNTVSWEWTPIDGATYYCMWRRKLGGSWSQVNVPTTDTHTSLAGWDVGETYEISQRVCSKATGTGSPYLSDYEKGVYVNIV